MFTYIVNLNDTNDGRKFENSFKDIILKSNSSVKKIEINLRHLFWFENLKLKIENILKIFLKKETNFLLALLECHTNPVIYRLMFYSAIAAETLCIAKANNNPNLCF